MRTLRFVVNIISQNDEKLFGSLSYGNDVQLLLQKTILLLLPFSLILFNQVEGDATYLAIVDAENDVLDETNYPDPNACAETNFPYDFEEDSETESEEMYQQKSISNI